MHNPRRKTDRTSYKSNDDKRNEQFNKISDKKNLNGINQKTLSNYFNYSCCNSLEKEGINSNNLMKIF